MTGRRARAPEARLWQAALDDTTSLAPGRAGLRLTCRTGTFLVTQELDPCDHPLEAGQSFETTRRGKVVAWALRAGTLEIRRRSEEVLERKREGAAVVRAAEECAASEGLP